MLNTQSRPSPSTFAALLAAKKANTATKQAGGLKPATPEHRRPYTTQSEGYEVRYVPLPTAKDIDVADVTPMIESEVEPETTYGASWMPGVEELGISWTSRLRRSTVIDEVDPNEALDESYEFLGFHTVAW